MLGSSADPLLSPKAGLISGQGSRQGGKRERQGGAALFHEICRFGVETEDLGTEDRRR